MERRLGQSLDACRVFGTGESALSPSHHANSQFREAQSPQPAAAEKRMSGIELGSGLIDYSQKNRVARAQAGALLTSHIAPGRRTLAPSRCGVSAARMDAMAAATTSAGWPRSQLLTAPIWVD